MLYLTRKQGEKIKVGDVVILIEDIKRGSVRIGVEAPKSMHIDRPEWEDKKD